MKLKRSSETISSKMLNAIRMDLYGVSILCYEEIPKDTLWFYVERPDDTYTWGVSLEAFKALQGREQRVNMVVDAFRDEFGVL